MKKMKTRNKLKKTLTALIAAGMIFIAGRTANAGEKKQIGLEDYLSKIKTELNSIKLKDYLPELEFGFEHPTPIRTAQDEAVREDLLPGGYEHHLGVITNRKYDGMKKGISFSIKQPIPIVKADINFKQNEIRENGDYSKYQDFLRGSDIDAWQGEYDRSISRKDLFLSKKFKAGKKIEIEPRIGSTNRTETVRGAINPDNYDYLPYNEDQESWSGEGILRGVRIGSKNLEADVEYTNTTGANTSTWTDSSFKYFDYVRNSIISGTLKTKSLKASLNYKPNAKPNSIIGRANARVFGEIVGRNLSDTKYECGFTGTNRNFNHSYADLGFEVGKGLSDKLTVEVGVEGRVNLSCSGETVYKESTSPKLTAKLRGVFDLKSPKFIEAVKAVYKELTRKREKQESQGEEK